MRKILVCLIIMFVAINYVFASGLEAGMSVIPYEKNFLDGVSSSYGYGLRFEGARNFADHVKIGAEIGAETDRLNAGHELYLDISSIEGMLKAGVYSGIGSNLAIGVDAKFGMSFVNYSYNKTKLGIVFGGGIYSSYAFAENVLFKLGVDGIFSPDFVYRMGYRNWSMTIRPYAGLTMRF